MSNEAPARTEQGTAGVQIGILGGGPAGLMAALCLEAYLPVSVSITLFDRNQSETDYPGVEYGIQA